jgi:secreted Zn-dependent insulinase-like peptidase
VELLRYLFVEHVKLVGYAELDGIQVKIAGFHHTPSALSGHFLQVLEQVADQCKRRNSRDRMSKLYI